MLEARTLEAEKLFRTEGRYLNQFKKFGQDLGYLKVFKNYKRKKLNCPFLSDEVSRFSQISSFPRQIYLSSSKRFSLNIGNVSKYITVIAKTEISELQPGYVLYEFCIFCFRISSIHKFQEM